MNAPAANTPDWHALRAEAVGGSDIGSIFGIYPDDKDGFFEDANPLEVWRLKTGRRAPDPGNAATARGARLEAWIAQATAFHMGLRRGPGTAFMRHPEWPSVRFQANTDGSLIWNGPPGLLECKAVKFSARHPSQGGVCQALLRGWMPLGFAMQTQAYLDALGLSWGVLGAFIGPDGHDAWRVEDLLGLRVVSYRLNPGAVEIIKEVLGEFWRCVESDTPPTWKQHRLLPAAKLALTPKAIGARLARPLRRAPVVLIGAAWGKLRNRLVLLCGCGVVVEHPADRHSIACRVCGGKDDLRAVRRRHPEGLFVV